MLNLTSDGFQLFNISDLHQREKQHSYFQITSTENDNSVMICNDSFQ